MNEVNMVENVVEIKDLTKKYDGFTLDHVSFAVPTGTVMGFIGQNGAGKSTTIKSLLHVIDVDEGVINIFGLDHVKEERLIKENIAVVFDELPFHETFTPKQLNTVLKGLYINWHEDTFFQFLDRFQLPRNKKISQFSKGMKMKLQIATALSHDAKLLVMDEATTGLDPIVRNEILDIFREYMRDENHSILMSSHITSDLDKIADGITFIDKGKILLTGYKDEILENHGMVKCSHEDFKNISREDYISARKSDYNMELLTDQRKDFHHKYPGLLIENVSLEEIMLFYVHREKEVWES